MLRRLSDPLSQLVLAVTTAVGVACLLSAYLFWRHHYQERLEAAKLVAQKQASLVKLGLEHQMQENERELIAAMVSAFAKDPAIAEVRILDRKGRTRFSGSSPKESFEPSCATCHETSAPKARASFIGADQGELLRVVLPIENRAACHECHEPEQTVNGALVMDVRAGAILETVDKDLRWLTVVLAAIALGLLATIALSVRGLLLKRLQRMGETARAISAGELDRRLPVSGKDTLSWMARSFNDMADSVTKLAVELREQRELLEMVINSVDDGIAVLDRQHRFLAANDAFLARIQRSPQDVSGARCLDVVGGRCPVGSCPSGECFHSGQRQSAVLSRGTPDGSTRLEELHASPIRSAGEVIAVVEVWRDITERRAAEARMAESHRMASLGMLASGFSHELNTPLATTLTCIESMLRVLESGQPITAEQLSFMKEYAGISREQILRCGGITQQFLRLSRGQKVAADLVELLPLTRSVVRLVEPTASEKGVSIECPEQLPNAVVRAADAELQQVLMNLLINAVQACSRGGRVLVGIEPGPPVRLWVKDDGCGIAEDQLPKIFEPFYGLRPGGTGLGLFLSLAMARGWGAEIGVKSGPGKGSEFEVRFSQDEARKTVEA